MELPSGGGERMLPAPQPRIGEIEPFKVHFRLTSSRCQRRSVWGVTMKQDQWSLGRIRDAAARKILSLRRSLGLPALREDFHLVPKDEDLDLAVAPVACLSQAEDDAKRHIKE